MTKTKGLGNVRDMIKAKDLYATLAQVVFILPVSAFGLTGGGATETR